MNAKDQYKMDREKKLEALKVLGVKSLPLHLAAMFMPDLPEWQEFRLRKSRKSQSGGRK